MKETKRMSAAQRRARQRKQRNRRIAMTVALVLVVALASIGGTIAWLTDTTNEVTNTFTVGDIDIELTETPNADDPKDEDTELDHWEAKLVPGNSYVKDPKVTVKAGSEKCWLFVEVTTAGSIEYIDYEINAVGWRKGTGEGGDGIPANVYYRIVDTNTVDTSYYMLKDKASLSTAENQVNGSVKIKENLTKETVNGSGFSAPTITFKAYACQYENRNVEEAWEAVKSTT